MAAKKSKYGLVFFLNLQENHHSNNKDSLSTQMQYTA